jgi:hypothetical protein
MHETDAMQFVEPVLKGFFDRNFELNKSEDVHFVELCLDEVRTFIQDAEPYWVKEKSRLIIEKIESAENQIRSGLYTPDTVGDFLATVLKKVTKELEDYGKVHQLENDKGKTSIFVSLPSVSVHR